MEKDNVKHIDEIEILQKRIDELVAIATERDEAKKIADEVKKIAEKVKAVALEAKELADNIADAVRDPLIVLDPSLMVLSVNNAFYNTFEVIPDETIGKFIYDLGNKQWDIPTLRKLLEDILPKEGVLNDYIISHNFPIIGDRTMVLNARRIPRPPQKAKMLLLAIEDITDMDRPDMPFEKMLEMGLFSKIAIDRQVIIDELKKEVDALLIRLGEKPKYVIGAK